MELRKTDFIGVSGETLLHALDGSGNIVGGLQVARFDEDLSHGFLTPMVVELRSEIARDRIGSVELQSLFHERLGGVPVLRQQSTSVLNQRAEQGRARDGVARIEALGLAQRLQAGLDLARGAPLLAFL